MHPAESSSNQIDLSWIDLGPEIAAGLFGLLALYTLALLAATLHKPLPGFAWLGGHTLHRDLVVGLAMLALVPALALGLVLAKRAAEQREDRAVSTLHDTALDVATQLDQLFAAHRKDIALLARTVANEAQPDAAALAATLASHHAIYDDYLTMLATDAAGTILCATALVAGQPQQISVIGHSVADRPYFALPMRNGGSFISDVFRGRGLGNDVIVAVSHAVVDATGKRQGIVEGSLDLRSLGRFPSVVRAVERGADLFIVDSTARVIYSSDAVRYPPLGHLNQSDFVTPPRAHRAAGQRHIVADETTDMGWRVVARLPLQPIKASVLSDFRVTTIWLLATVCAAAMLSAALARRVRRPLQALTAAVRSLDVDGIDAKIAAPTGAPDEIKAVFAHLSTVAERMHNSYRQLSAASEAGKHYRDQLEQTLSRRDEEIASRTRELEESNRKLLTLSNVDALTGLANRRHFLETIDRVWRHGMRERSPVSVAIVDLDHFKAYNDTYGHQGGDQCLVRVAGAMASVVSRSLDMVARCGGEEFMIVLGNTELADALSIAERTRQLVEDLAIPHIGSSTDSIVTLSVGVASAVPRRGSHHDELIRLADRALYHAKERGRNKVAWTCGDKLEIYASQIALPCPRAPRTVPEQA